jgi:hypothetical protein
MFDPDNPQHQRFCGTGWNDANENCSVERHCPSGDSLGEGSLLCSFAWGVTCDAMVYARFRLPL